MLTLKPDYFFDLTSFAHRSLFDDLTFVWEALKKITPYLKASSLGKVEVSIPSGVHLVNPETITIGPGTIVEPGAYIKGPCLIGAHCTIRQGAYIRGDLICGDHCVIGHDTEVKNAILLNGAQAAHFAYVGDSILGNHVNLGAGTKCANLKFDHSSVVIHADGQKFDTGMRKLGAIIGDDTQLGCNTVTNPGTLLGKQVDIYPCLNVGGCIPSGFRVKGSSSLNIISKAQV